MLLSVGRKTSLHIIIYFYLSVSVKFSFFYSSIWILKWHRFKDSGKKWPGLKKWSNSDLHSIERLHFVSSFCSRETGRFRWGWFYSLQIEESKNRKILQICLVKETSEVTVNQLADRIKYLFFSHIVNYMELHH